jgi:hypothetical protein
MNNLRLALTLGFALSAIGSAASLKLKDLPAAVQKTVTENLKGGEIKTIGKEVEKGVTQYEIETLRNGKHRDINVDAKGKLLVVEEEIDLASIPPAAKATIEKKLAGGKLRTLESVDKGDGAMLYEAAYTTKAGKKASILVKADGAETKD